MPYTEHKYVYILYMSVPCELGWKLENKLKNGVKIQNFTHKMSIKQ